MTGITPHEKFSASRPRKGDPVAYRGNPAGTVQSVERELCWVNYGGGKSEPFIWAFRDGLNNLHDWPSKEPGRNAP